MITESLLKFGQRTVQEVDRMIEQQVAAEREALVALLEDHRLRDNIHDEVVNELEAAIRARGKE